MKHIILITSILLVFLSTLSAQDSDNRKYTHQAGFTAGTFFGLAPTYRYNMGDNAVQISALPIFNNGNFRYSLSAGYLRKIARSRNADISLVISANYNKRFVGNSTSFHAGTQYEFKLSRFLTLETQLGLGYWNTNELINEFDLSILTASGGVSLLYNFLEK